MPTYITYFYKRTTEVNVQRECLIKPSIYEGIEKYITVGLTVMHQVRKMSEKS